MRIAFASFALLAAAALTAAAEDDFAPKNFILAPDDAPEIPRPELGLGEPLPEDPGAAARPADGENFEAVEAAPSPAQDEEAAREQVNALFAAIDDNDLEKVRSLLAEGVAPDATLPAPLDGALLERFRRDFLLYYVTKESGLTPLMFAAARGRLEIAKLLMEQGAKQSARTKRHGTDALWLAGYAGHVGVIQLLLGVQPGSEADRTLLEVDLTTQEATLIRDESAVATVPISSGKKKFETPKGEFVVTNKHRHWKSTLYGASMPFYLRLSSRDFGLHAGHLPGYPASHGCIRLRQKDAAEFFKQVPVGTKVVIK